MNFYRFIIPRLNGKDIGKDFDYHLGLVRKGIAGFIIFGGELGELRKGIGELQKEAKGSLIIASDLERGLGQQVRGGTLFPPAMGIAEAIRRGEGLGVRGQGLVLLKKVFRAIALEARYAGINTIFAPVLDVNTNPKNPIIATRAFGEDPELVSFFGCEMIKIFQANGIAACGKHFPGHGDTEVDSHIKLPVVNKNLVSLERTELVPFRKAIDAGVKMIMMGHLKVPALDPSGIPVSLSPKSVAYLRKKMGFKGMIITDALNMGGIGKYSEEEASLMALEAGVDILLHPTDPDKIVSYLEKKRSAINCQPSAKKLFDKKARAAVIPDFKNNKRLSEEISKMAIYGGSTSIKMLKKPVLVVLSDDSGSEGQVLYAELRRRYPSLKKLRPKDGDKIDLKGIQMESEIIVAVFSKVKAWKGGSSPWLLRSLKKLDGRASLFISFGSPYLLDEIKGDAAKVFAYWDSDLAQKAVAEMIAAKSHFG